MYIQLLLLLSLEPSCLDHSCVFSCCENLDSCVHMQRSQDRSVSTTPHPCLQNISSSIDFCFLDATHTLNGHEINTSTQLTSTVHSEMTKGSYNNYNMKISLATAQDSFFSMHYDCNYCIHTLSHHLFPTAHC